MTEQRMGDLEEIYLDSTDFNSLDEACISHADQQEHGVHECESVTALVATREPIDARLDGDIRHYEEGTILVGEVEFTENIPYERIVQYFWAKRFCPLIDPEVLTPVVGGGLVGRDNSVCIFPHILADDATPEEIQRSHDQINEFYDVLAEGV